MSLSTWLQGVFPSSGAGLIEAFHTPPMAARPKLRWWWPHGLVEVEEIRTEVQQMYDAGFGGAEINDVHRGVTVELDPEGHGYGTGPWLDAVQAASELAESLDFQIDLALGPSYPASVPGLSPDDDAAAKEIATGRVLVAPGQSYSGPVPTPYVAAENGVNNETLIALQAWRVNSAADTTKVPVVLDVGTLVDLMPEVKAGSVSFTPPDNGTWLVISYTMRGTNQVAEGGPHNEHDGSVIDHLSLAGIKAATDYFDKNILSPKLSGVLERIKGSFFEDSIELDYSTLWTPTLREEFKKRIGYDIFDYLPAVAQEKQKNAFSFSDAELNRGVINDFWTTVGEMYVDYHAGHMREWSSGYDMKFRAQTYGLPTEAIESSASVDIPEGESLGFKNMGDYRSLAGAANMKGLKLISNEACAFAASAYTVTWDLILQTLNPIFTSGNNHQVLHGFSYLNAPSTKWPGNAAFTPYGGNIGYSESWGPRIPLWNHATDITGYIGRMQTLMQRGQPKHDVAFFEQKGYVGAGYNSPWFADVGTMLGWSLNILGPSLFDLPSATVRDQMLAPDGPGYKLLAFEGDSFTSTRQAVAKLSTAKKIHEFAEAGLPMLIVGNWSSVSAYGRGEAEHNDEITALFADVLSRPNVVNVATRDDIGAGVAKVGVTPRVQYDAQLISYQRVDGDLDHFLLVASHPATYAVSTKTKVYDVDAEVILPRRDAKGVPLLMDLWTGAMTPLGQYEEVDDTHIRVRVSLKKYQATVITVAPLTKTPVHAVSSDAQLVRRADDGLYMRANVTGKFTARLSDGTEVTKKVCHVPRGLEIKGWSLTVQSWEPTDDIYSPETVHRNIELGPLDTLQPWTSYPELADVSGVGTYNATFSLGADGWSAKAGATLTVPDFVGSFRVTVNGQRLPPVDQLDRDFDIGAYVKKGDNTISIEVATPLLNRLRVADPGVYGVAKPQDYGLVSPITIAPYKEIKIAE